VIQFDCFILFVQQRLIRKGTEVRNTITIRLSEKLQRELEKVAKAERISKSELIRDALERYIALKRFRQLRKKVLSFIDAKKG